MPRLQKLPAGAVPTAGMPWRKATISYLCQPLLPDVQLQFQTHASMPASGHVGKQYACRRPIVWCTRWQASTHHKQPRRCPPQGIAQLPRIWCRPCGPVSGASSRLWCTVCQYLGKQLALQSGCSQEQLPAMSHASALRLEARHGTAWHAPRIVGACHVAPDTKSGHSAGVPGPAVCAAGKLQPGAGRGCTGPPAESPPSATGCAAARRQSCTRTVPVRTASPALACS